MKTKELSGHPRLSFKIFFVITKFAVPRYSKHYCNLLSKITKTTIPQSGCLLNTNKINMQSCKIKMRIFHSGCLLNTERKLICDRVKSKWGYFIGSQFMGTPLVAGRVQIRIHQIAVVHSHDITSGRTSNATFQNEFRTAWNALGLKLQQYGLRNMEAFDIIIRDITPQYRMEINPSWFGSRSTLLFHALLSTTNASKFERNILINRDIAVLKAILHLSRMYRQNWHRIWCKIRRLLCWIGHISIPDGK